MAIYPTYSVTEVAFAAHEKAGGVLDGTAEQNIDSLWAPTSAARLIEYHPGVAQRSRNLIREAITRGWSLKPGDAIHLATAESVDAVKLHTYNLSDFGRWAPVLGMTVENPVSANPQMV